MLPLLLKLGFWQLDRADQKRELKHHFANQLNAKPLLQNDIFDGLEISTLAFRRIKLVGEFLNEYTAFHDNQIVDGRPGYHVFTLFRESDSGFLYWVNRGWIPGKLNRELPSRQPVTEAKIAIEASIYIPPGESVVLDIDQWSKAWPLRIQTADINRLTSRLPEGLSASIIRLHASGGSGAFPYQLRLDPASQGALAIDWKIINTQPEKHMGYAIQWFAMAIALFLFWLYQSVAIEDRNLRQR